MFADKFEYESNMEQLWLLRSFIAKEGRKLGWPPGLDSSFHTLNNLIDALLPANGTYYPGHGLKMFNEGQADIKSLIDLDCITARN